MDWRIVPVLSLLYFLATLDRSNIANAKIEGMSEELHLYGERYNVALCVFYPTYILSSEFNISHSYPTLTYRHSLTCFLLFSNPVELDRCAREAAFLVSWRNDLSVGSGGNNAWPCSVLRRSRCSESCAWAFRVSDGVVFQAFLRSIHYIITY